MTHGLTDRRRGRALRCLLAALVLCGGGAAQSSQEYNISSNITDFTMTGQYDRALESFRRSGALGLSSRGLLMYMVRVLVEVGSLADAERVLFRASRIAPDEQWDAVVQREKAALLYEQGEYKIAATTAGGAFRTSLARGYSDLRAAYCRHIEAMSRLRAGDIAGAAELAGKAAKTVPKRTKKGAFFAPRILYGSCLAASYAAPAGASEQDCQRGLQIAQATRRQTRDLTLGHLALAEVRLRRGDFAGSRESAKTALELAGGMFGKSHQDVVSGVAILALANQREGKLADAQTLALQALEVGQAVFGDLPRMTELRRQLEPCLSPPAP